MSEVEQQFTFSNVWMYVLVFLLMGAIALGGL